MTEITEMNEMTGMTKMFAIKTEEVRKAVQDSYDFDKEHGKIVGATLNSTRYEIYEFDSRVRIYHFVDDNLSGYEG